MKEYHHTDHIIEKKTPDGVSFVTFPTLPYHGNASFGRIKNMWKFSLDVCRKVTSQKFGTPDIILGSTMTLFAANAARKLALKFHVPFVYEVRDLWPLTPIELGGYSKWHPFLLYLDYLDRKLSKNAELIITTAPLMKEYYKERFGLPDEKFLWITNGTDVEMFQQTEKAQDIKDKTTFDIYYTGAHGLANGLDKILDQMHVIKHRFPQVRLFLVGDGPMKPRLQERAKQEALPVVFLDPVPKKKLPSILTGADALIFYLEPCRLYRYGISLNKLADYHAAGKPILMVGECEQNPVLESGAGIVIRKTEDLPSAIGEMLEFEQAERKKMGLKGIQYAKINYDWNTLAQKITQSFKKLVH
jgi:glycosyltransferase involved in cell wall biosynthesis